MIEQQRPRVSRKAGEEEITEDKAKKSSKKPVAKQSSVRKKSKDSNSTSKAIFKTKTSKKIIFNIDNEENI